MTCILVIEDEDLIRESLEDLLLIEGFKVITANNGQKGVNLAIQQKPDLIICDVRMPKLNGYQVLEKVRQHEELTSVPFLFLTSLIDRHSYRQGMAMGADDYLEKPCTKVDLLTAITVRLNKQKDIERLIESKMEALRSSITLSLPHELQTPLSGIMGLSELMMIQSEDLIPTEVYECAEGIHISGKRLHRLIQNYLLFSKLLLLRSQGQTRFTAPYPCNSSSIIRNTSDRKAREGDRVDDLDLDLIEVDLGISSEDLTKITEELIDNAFKCSKKGSQVRLTSQVNDLQWIFTIEDHGRGMSQAQVANLGAYMQFERKFYEQQGVGLGLVLAKSLIEFYGGTMDMYSQENLGTKLSIFIPL